MGRNFEKRPRGAHLESIPDAALASLAETDFRFAHADSQLVADLVNKQLDKVQAKLEARDL